MTNELSKKEYLKRYLEADKDSDRKHKRKAKSVKPKANVPRLKIIDQDIDLKSINFGDNIQEDDGDEAPVIAEVIDERPIEEKIKELYESSRWKKINSDEISQSSSTLLSGSRDSKSSLQSFKKHISTERNDFASSRQDSSKRTRHDSDGDLSPPRNQERNSRKRHDSDNDLSPVRSQKRHSDRDTSSSRSYKQNRSSTKHDSDSDISPPRHQTLSKSTSQSKDKSKRYDSDSDISPPRHLSVNKSNSQLKNSSKKYDSDGDISPPRPSTANKSSSQMKNSSKRYDSGNDISPPCRQSGSKSDSQVKNSSGRYDSDSDEASLRYQNHSPKMLKSNKRSRSRMSSNSDMSPPRSSSELSTIKGKDKKLGKTLSGLKAGLQNSETLQEEVQELRKREKMQLKMLDDEISGRNADTVIRDRKTGMKRDLNKEQEAKTEENKKAKAYEQKYNKWGKGIEQTENKMEKYKDDLYEMSKPLARYRDDEDLDERLKSIIRDDDPMSEYMKKKRKKDAPCGVPVYSGPPAPPNRFGILPGYRWDGVDRSNGFEKKYFEKINSTKAIQDEAYLWSIQDM